MYFDGKFVHLFLIVLFGININELQSLETSLSEVDNGQNAEKESEPCTTNHSSCNWCLQDLLNLPRSKRNVEPIEVFEEKLGNLTEYPIFIAVRKGTKLGKKMSRMLKEWTSYELQKKDLNMLNGSLNFQV